MRARMVKENANKAEDFHFAPNIKSTENRCPTVESHLSIKSANDAKCNRKHSPQSLADLVKCTEKLNSVLNGVEVSNNRSQPWKSEKSPTSEADFSIASNIEQNTVPPVCKDNLDACNNPSFTATADIVESERVIRKVRQFERFCENEDRETSRYPCKKLINENQIATEQKLSNHDNELYVSDDETARSECDSVGSVEDEEVLAELGLSHLMHELESDFIDNQNNSNEIRSFRVLWEVLMRWISPSTIRLVCQYQSQTEQYEDHEWLPEMSTSLSSQEDLIEESKNDEPSRNIVAIGASRRAGVMSMIKMNVSRSILELKKMYERFQQNELSVRTSNLQLEDVPISKTFNGSSTSSANQNTHFELNQRKIEQRLAQLVKTFDFSGPVTNLSMKLWRGMTTVLIAIVHPFNDDTFGKTIPLDALQSDYLLPTSVRSLGVSIDEYRYLTVSSWTYLDKEL